MNRRNSWITTAIIAILLILCYWLYGNSYTLLKPIQVENSKMVVIPFNEKITRNFPDVLKYYHVPYKINDSGRYMIQVKYARDRDLVLTMTNCTLDSTQMKMLQLKH